MGKILGIEEKEVGRQPLLWQEIKEPFGTTQAAAVCVCVCTCASWGWGQAQTNICSGPQGWPGVCMSVRVCRGLG